MDTANFLRDLWLISAKSNPVLVSAIPELLELEHPELITIAEIDKGVYEGNWPFAYLKGANILSVGAIVLHMTT